MKICKESGITLVALIVTIIILIILAGITIGVLTGDDGLINNANNAKEQTEIANEKEIVDRATINAMGNNKRGNIVKDELQEELDRITKVGDTEVEDNGEEFEVVFVNTQRYYTVNKDGDIIEEGKIVIDKSPGDITKDENGNSLRGDESEPYEIWCIEDLVAFSKEVNDNNTYENKYICLMQDLNFSSNYSYTDPTTTEYDTYLGGDGNTSIKEQLSNRGKGFRSIGSSTIQFWGHFNGNGNKIKNLYTKEIGFFGEIKYATIKNITIQGNVQSETSASAGGIVTSATSSYIYNCCNQIDVTRSSCCWNMLFCYK